MSNGKTEVSPDIVVSPTLSRVLVVDDEASLCDICARALRRSGYMVTATTSADEALQLLHSDETFDLLITDIRMPTISGLELARQAREGDPAIAIIIMTGHTSEDHLRQAVQRGAADFISKPFDLEELRLAVDQALHKRRLLQDSLRLQSAERLLQSSEALNATLDRTELTHTILDTALEYTGAAAAILILREGRRAAEMLVLRPSVALLPAGRDIVNQVHYTGHPHSAMIPMGTLDGRPIAGGSAVPIRSRGEVLGVLLLCDDRPDAFPSGVQESLVLLTNQAGTALRNALLYSQVQESNRRLQDLDRLKGEFIAIASHELRTPLSIVLGYTMMVRDQTSGDHREYLQRVMDGAQRIKDIIDDMVSLRHLETGKAQLNLQPAVLQTVIRQAVDRMLPVAHAKAQQFNAYLPERPISCMVDREKLLLILGNLISNAVKFTPERGMLAVCADIWNTAAPNATSPLHTGRAIPIILPEQLDAGIWIVVQVRDNGIGIPEPEQDRIFERFYQVASSLTREHGGTGLGLAIVQELVMLLQGAVWVDSSKTQGSVFSFAIPYVPMHSVEANS